MNFKARSIALVLFLLILPQFACSLSGSEGQPPAEAVATGSKPGKTDVPTVKKTLAPPTPDIQVSDPDPGMANVVGRILWNEMPAVDLEVKLCEEMGMFSGCEGAEYSVQTDTEGVYLFAGIAPGGYALAVESHDGEHWLYVTAGLGIGAKKYEVAADETLRIPDQPIYKFDLIQTYPGDEDSIADGKPVLEWDPYPDASYYEVYLTQENGSAIFVNEKTETNSITPKNDLLTCEYTWQVEAYNSQGTKIAEQDGYSHFTILGQPLSCYLDVISPASGASVAGSGIVLEWKAHELAQYYRVHIWDADYKDLLEGMKVDGTTYAVPQTLAPGKYTWYVSALDSDEMEFARSEFIEFTVTE